MAKSSLLFITLEPISDQMAGPAIRCLEMGRALSDEFEITLFSPHPTNLSIKQEPNLKIAAGLKKSALYKIAQEAEVVIIQANVLKAYPAIARLAKHLVVDLYDPYLFSIHIQYEDNPETASSSFALMYHLLREHMLVADFTICASEQQRDYWLGRFCALGRITPTLHNFDPTLRKLIDVVPFGLSSTPPVRTGAGLRGTISGINESDRILLWGGGIWDWFDPLTIIRATAALSNTTSNIKLVFMGTKSPNPQVPLMKMVKEARQLSESLAVLNKHVFFPQQWVNYQDRANFLLDADIAVSAHFDLPETRFSFRTRILDYFWAGLPIITTLGDPLAELIQTKEAGIAVPYQNVTAWQEAITKLLTDKTWATAARLHSAQLAKNFSWQKVVAPLRTYCHKPYKLPPYKKIVKPSLFTRAKAVYARGGKELFLDRSAKLLQDLLP